MDEEGETPPDPLSKGENRVAEEPETKQYRLSGGKMDEWTNGRMDERAKGLILSGKKNEEKEAGE